jgi:hypothetical protein
VSVRDLDMQGLAGPAIGEALRDARIAAIRREKARAAVESG